MQSHSQREDARPYRMQWSSWQCKPSAHNILRSHSIDDLCDLAHHAHPRQPQVSRQSAGHRAARHPLLCGRSAGHFGGLPTWLPVSTPLTSYLALRPFHSRSLTSVQVSATIQASEACWWSSLRAPAHVNRHLFRFVTECTGNAVRFLYLSAGRSCLNQQSLCPCLLYAGTETRAGAASTRSRASSMPRAQTCCATLRRWSCGRSRRRRPGCVSSSAVDLMNMMQEHKAMSLIPLPAPVADLRLLLLHGGSLCTENAMQMYFCIIYSQRRWSSSRCSALTAFRR